MSRRYGASRRSSPPPSIVISLAADGIYVDGIDDNGAKMTQRVAVRQRVRARLRRRSLQPAVLRVAAYVASFGMGVPVSSATEVLKSLAGNGQDRRHGRHPDRPRPRRMGQHPGPWGHLHAGRCGNLPTPTATACPTVGGRTCSSRSKRRCSACAPRARVTRRSTSRPRRRASSGRGERCRRREGRSTSPGVAPPRRWRLRPRSHRSPNASSTVHLPAANARDVTEGGRRCAPCGRPAVEREWGRVVVRAGAGRYEFRVGTGA